MLEAPLTFAEFLSLIEEYQLPVEGPERFRFMIRDTSAAEFRKFLDSDDGERVWTLMVGDEEDPGEGDLTDGCGNRWIRPPEG
jgi:hypothetical protein